MSALATLARVGSVAVRDTAVADGLLIDALGEIAAGHIRPLLGEKNGFYAFEGALHVFSDLGTTQEKGVLEWNSDGLWRSAYDGLAGEAVFFAEDVFGVQFCVLDGSIATFDPETGAFETIAKDMEAWAAQILSDASLWTGYGLAHEWQMRHGPLPPGERLVPKIPFVLGGEYDVANLHALDATKAMLFRASIAVQIRDLPDGAAIKLRVVE